MGWNDHVMGPGYEHLREDEDMSRNSCEHLGYQDICEDCKILRNFGDINEKNDLERIFFQSVFSADERLRRGEYPGGETTNLHDEAMKYAGERYMVMKADYDERVQLRERMAALRAEVELLKRQNKNLHDGIDPIVEENKSLRARIALLEKAATIGQELSDLISETAPLTWVRPEFAEAAHTWEKRAHVAIERFAALAEGKE